MAANASLPQLTLYTYFRSSCSARVRTALHHKTLPFTSIPIHLLSGSQTDPTYTSLNPSRSVPTLTVSTPDSTIVITQSVAILEYLEEAFPPPIYPRLLPEAAEDRAFVRDLVGILASDTQPVTNLRVLKEVERVSGTEARGEWVKKFMELGLQAYESRLSQLPEKKRGIYSFGNEVTLADVCLAPAVEGALRFGCDLGALKRVREIYENLRGMEAFIKGDWKHQEDTPAEFRV